jgi:hypothetical protein
VFLTDSLDNDLAYLKVRHRGHARVEDRIRCAKDSLLRTSLLRVRQQRGVGGVVLIAQDLIAWTQGLCLTGKPAKAEPKALRFMLLHVAGRLVGGWRRREPPTPGRTGLGRRPFRAFGRLQRLAFAS